MLSSSTAYLLFQHRRAWVTLLACFFLCLLAVGCQAIVETRDAPSAEPAANCSGDCPGAPPPAAPQGTCELPPKVCNTIINNPITGQCAYAPIANGTTCSDGDACTSDDACDNGVCVSPGHRKGCRPPRNTCLQASCNAQTGSCETSPKPAGASCNDGNPCTQTDVCQSGTCVGSNPVTCAAIDQCHSAGTCDPTTGQCSIPEKPYHTACDDGESCTQSDECRWGACVGLLPKANGAACNDTNACTQTDTCQTGTCTGANPVVCAALNQCHSPGQCDPSTGTCSNPLKPAGVACADGDACTEGDTCDEAGACISGAFIALDDTNRCTADSCDPLVGVSHTILEGALCSDDPCQGFKRCDAGGDCIGEHLPNGTPCPGSDDPCMPHACSGGACTAFVAVSARCSDDNPCTTNDTCSAAGVCQGTPDTGTGCDDADACNGVEICSAGACILGTPVDVDDSDSKTLDVCDPLTGAVLHSPCGADLDPTVSTTLAALAQCLYAGADPIQVGIPRQPFPLDLEPLSEDAPFPPNRIAVLRGKVSTSDGSALPGVTIQVMGQPESGRTFSRVDGRFDMAVHGGGLLTVSYTKAGHPLAQRQIQTAWMQVATLPDVALIPFDANATHIELGASATELQVARGRRVEDDDGSRQAMMMVRPATTATMTLPDGTTQALDALTVRATEYTEGDSGPEAMPAVLPPAVAYTYCLELSADEAVAAGATRVEFSEPVVFYVENFLGFPVGGIVPAGSYDRVKSAWIPEPNGTVVQVVSVEGGIAEVDTDGDGAADNTGIDMEERARLGALYAPGVSLWRVEMGHFTPWDLNWPYGLPDDACEPGDAVCALPSPPHEALLDDPNCTSGSIIECENQVLGETVGVTGTPFTLNYRSDRQPGRRDAYTMRIPLSGPSSLSSSLSAIHYFVEVESVGVVLDGFSTSNAPNQVEEFTWNGKDKEGRTVQGTRRATVHVGYVYSLLYMKPADVAASFGRVGGERLQIDRQAATATLWAPPWHRDLGGWNTLSKGLGGWDLSVHHSYDLTGKLYLGDGSQRNVAGIEPVIRTLLGGTDSDQWSEFGPAISAYSGFPHGIAVASNGTIYFADPSIDRVRAISPDGMIRTIAGTGSPGAGGGYNGDDRLATSALLFTPMDVAFGPDGSLYIADGSNFRVRHVDADGFIHTVAGKASEEMPQINTGDGGLATEATLAFPSGIAVDATGNIYIALKNRIRRVDTNGIITTVFNKDGLDYSYGDGGPAVTAGGVEVKGIDVGLQGDLYFIEGSRIRHVDREGIITTIAGGIRDYSPDGTLAKDAKLKDPHTIAVTPDGTILFAEGSISDYQHRVREIGTDKILATIAGTRDPVCVIDRYCGESGPACAAQLGHISGVAVEPNGSVLIADTIAQRLLRVAPAFPGVGVNDIAVPSEDGAQVYIFDARGTHKSTWNALTGVKLYQFGYDLQNRLVTVTDTDNLVMTIFRDGFGYPTTIQGPYGDQTTLKLDANGYLKTVTNPAGESVKLSHSANGLLQSFTDPRDKTHIFVYDNAGRLVLDSQPIDAGGHKTLARTALASGHQVTVTTASAISTTHRVEQLSDGRQRRTTMFPSGLMSIVDIATDGRRTSTFPDGTTAITTKQADPRFGMLSPLLTSVATLPSGKALTVMTARTTTLADPNNLLDVAELVETTIVNGRAFTTTYEAHPTGNTILSMTPSGRTTLSTLGAKGRTVRVDVPGLASSELSYDSVGRLESITRGQRAWALSYDAAGNLASATDPLGRATTFDHYDLARRLLSQTLPGYREVHLGYDLSGNPTLVEPPPTTPKLGDPPLPPQQHHFELTSIDQLAAYDAPNVSSAQSSTGRTEYAYDADGHLTSVTRPDGSVLALSYDAADRLEEVTLPNSKGTLTPYYNGATGALSAIDGPVAGTRVSFAHDGPLPTEIAWTGVVVKDLRVHRDYDGDLRLGCECLNGACTFANGVCSGSGTAQVAFGYDADGLLTSAGAASLTRDLANGLLTGTSTGVVAEAYTWSEYGELEALVAERVLGGTPETLFTVDATRDALGRIVERVELIATAGGPETRTIEYGYDTAGRLETVSEDGVPVRQYHYDLNGNRLKASDLVAETESRGEYDAQDRLVAYGTTQYQYTPNGELAKKIEAPNVETTYTYDALGSLRSVGLPDGRAVGYLVDGAGRRIWKKVNGALVQGFLYRNALQIAAELDGSGNIVKRFVYASRGNVPDYMVTGGETFRIVSDHLGSPRLVVNTATGAITARMDYDEFGRVRAGSDVGAVPFGFAGGLRDVDTGLLRFGARDYDPEVGRWTGKDPSRFGGGLNLYGYCHGDPVNYVDLSGAVPEGARDFGYGFAGIGREAADVQAALSEGAAMAVQGALELALGELGGAALGRLAGAVGRMCGGAARAAEAATSPVGRLGSPMTVPRSTNAATVIGGRKFTGHALDQMQGRGLTPSVVEDTIAHGVGNTGRDGAAIFQTDQARVILNPDGSVKTVMPFSR